MLDNFLRDNVECGTAAMNYFSKLRRITSNVFPHLVPVCEPSKDKVDELNAPQDRYRELMRSARIWRLLKLLKWSGTGHLSPAEQLQPQTLQRPDRTDGQGDLVLFCPACPQPGINLSMSEEADLSQ